MSQLITDFADSITDSLDTACQEMYWEGGYDSGLFEQVILSEASKQGVALYSDMDTDLDGFGFDFYRDTEKGLS